MTTPTPLTTQQRLKLKSSQPQEQPQLKQPEELVVLVTGSRTWTDKETVESALTKIHHGLMPHQRPVLVHGDCPTGADRIARNWATQHRWTIRPYPANWSLGNQAGPLRNQEMIKKERPHVVLAFCKNKSRGTTGTVKLARAYGNEPSSRLQRLVTVSA